MYKYSNNLGGENIMLIKIQYTDLTNKQRDLKTKIKECKNFIKHINK